MSQGGDVFAANTRINRYIVECKLLSAVPSQLAIAELIDT